MNLSAQPNQSYRALTSLTPVWHLLKEPKDDVITALAESCRDPVIVVEFLVVILLYILERIEVLHGPV